MTTIDYATMLAEFGQYPQSRSGSGGLPVGPVTLEYNGALATEMAKLGAKDGLRILWQTLKPLSRRCKWNQSTGALVATDRGQAADDTRELRRLSRALRRELKKREAIQLASSLVSDEEDRQSRIEIATTHQAQQDLVNVAVERVRQFASRTHIEDSNGRRELTDRLVELAKVIKRVGAADRLESLASESAEILFAKKIFAAALHGDRSQIATLLKIAGEKSTPSARIEIANYLGDIGWKLWNFNADRQVHSDASGDVIPTSEAPTSKSSPVPESDPHNFEGGVLAFFEDRVELCDVDICSGPRCASRRVVLELLTRRKDGRGFVAYSGEELQSLVKQHGAKGVVSGLIRDLRRDICEAFGAKSNITISREDVILSGGMGYRFSDRVTVQFAFRKVITDISDMAKPADVRNDDVRNVFNVHDDEAARRRTWIVRQLQAGVQLKAPMVAAQFNRTKKTAQRDLDALRDDGQIEFVGDRRTGYYRLVACK